LKSGREGDNGRSQGCSRRALNVGRFRGILFRLRKSVHILGDVIELEGTKPRHKNKWRIMANERTIKEKEEYDTKKERNIRNKSKL
jgi:hypothetical protein